MKEAVQNSSLGLGVQNWNNYVYERDREKMHLLKNDTDDYVMAFD